MIECSFGEKQSHLGGQWFWFCSNKEFYLHTRITSNTPIDLHLHTTYSDGRWSAEQLLDYLVQEEFGLIAITDHDRVETVVGIQQMDDEIRLPVLAGVEISAEWHGKMGDVLCYGFDPHDVALRAIADQVRQRQKTNAEEVYDELLRRGYHFPQQADVLKASGGELRVAGDSALLETRLCSRLGQRIGADPGGRLP